MSEIPKVVFSNSLTLADWADATIVRADLTEAVTRLKAERDRCLLALGGVGFAQSLARTGLVDEYQLVVHPVVLGDGAPLFTTPLAIEPISTIAFRRGAVAHTFTAQA
jgi:dihydrofolate reductase